MMTNAWSRLAALLKTADHGRLDRLDASLISSIAPVRELSRPG
jgi:hypothetical protein